MESKTRLIYLQEFYSEQPNDPFATYAIGLEYLNMGDLGAAKKWFMMTYDAHPDYLPVFYQLGTLLLELNDTTLAKRIITEGQLVAKQQDDHKTWSELDSLLN